VAVGDALGAAVEFESLPHRLQRPHKRPVRADPAAQEAFKTNSRASFVAFIESIPAREWSCGRKTKHASG
jgi:hypothetical protein